MTNKDLNFVVSQPTNWDKISDEDDLESQEDENDSKVRYHKGNI